LARRIQYITIVPTKEKIQRYIKKYEEEIQEKKDKFKIAWYQEKKKFIEEEEVVMNQMEYKERKKCGCGDDNFWYSKICKTKDERKAIKGNNWLKKRLYEVRKRYKEKPYKIFDKLTLKFNKIGEEKRKRLQV
jgi:hypothetical protein